jgi:hypothetical protein
MQQGGKKIQLSTLETLRNTYGPTRKNDYQGDLNVFLNGVKQNVIHDKNIRLQDLKTDLQKSDEFQRAFQEYLDLPEDDRKNVTVLNKKILELLLIIENVKNLKFTYDTKVEKIVQEISPVQKETQTSQESPLFNKVEEIVQEISSVQKETQTSQESPLSEQDLIKALKESFNAVEEKKFESFKVEFRKTSVGKTIIGNEEVSKDLEDIFNAMKKVAKNNKIDDEGIAKLQRDPTVWQKIKMWIEKFVHTFKEQTTGKSKIDFKRTTGKFTEKIKEEKTGLKISY